MVSVGVGRVQSALLHRAGESDRGARVILCFLSHQICMIYSARFPGLAQVAEPRGVTGQGRHLP
jgi:hypothetical protein